MTVPQSELHHDAAHNDAAVCEACEGGGWEVFGTGRGDPHFRECEKCHNPEGHPCP
jgi:hypothetical protein